MADIPPDPIAAMIGIKLSHLIAGAAGGLVRSLSRPGGSIGRHIVTTVVGTLVAGYGTPVCSVLAARYLAAPEIPAASVEGVVGFLLGVSGMTLAEACIRKIREWRGAAPPAA